MTGRRKKHDTPAFLHDANARRDWKMLDLRAAGGMEYVGIYWSLIEIMREQGDDCSLQKRALRGAAQDLGIDLPKLQAFIEAALQTGLLIESSVEHEETGGWYYSQSLIERIAAYKGTSLVRSEAGKAGAAARWQNNGNCHPLATTSDGSSIANGSQTDGLRGKINLTESNITKSNAATAAPAAELLTFGKYARISPIDYEQYTALKGAEFLKRCFEKINGWVEDTEDSTEHLRRAKRAQNASALFQNWVFNAVENEPKSSAQKSPRKNELYEKVIQAVRKFGDHRYEEAKRTLPAETLPAVARVGWGNFCRARENDPGIKQRFFEALGN